MTDLSNPDLEREKYWNEKYVRYWKARVAEANKNLSETSTLVAGDTKTSDDAIYKDGIALLEIKKSDTVLELGCGFGRSLSFLCRLASHVFAVDISKEMIDAAKEICHESNIDFFVAPSERLPFAKDTLDIVICFAVFDATYQLETLMEINRVCREGARILITGKNDNYCDDDNAALAAEIGARKKNHPNYFTDVNLLLKNMKKFGFEIEDQNFFLRRGDFSKQKYTNKLPAFFYEYQFVLKKSDVCKLSVPIFISHHCSKTYFQTK